MKPKVKIYITSTMLLAVLLYAAWPDPELQGIRVHRGDLVQNLVLPGKVQRADSIAISSKADGKVSSVAVTEGDVVLAGQTLVSLENSRERDNLVRAQKETAMAMLRFKQEQQKLRSGVDQAVEKAKSSLEHSKKQYARLNDLAAKGMVSSTQTHDALRNLAIAQSQLSTAQFQAKTSRNQGSAYALAESALNNARARQKAAQEKLDNTMIKALVEGKVSKCAIASGMQIQAGQPLLEISSAGKTQVQVALDATTQPQIKSGQPVRIVGSANQQHINLDLGKVPDDFNTMLKFEFGSAPAAFKHDMTVSVWIEVVHLHDVLTLPANTIHDAGTAQPWVMAVQDGKAQRRNIKLGTSGDGHAEILDGLQEGEVVLSAALPQIEEGKRIRLAKN